MDIEQRARASLHVYFESVKKMSQITGRSMVEIVREQWVGEVPLGLVHLIPKYPDEPLALQTSFGPLQYDPSSRTVVSPLLDGKLIQLTRREAMIFQELVADPLRVVPYRHLAVAVWEGFNASPSVRDIRALRQYVSTLREKLGDHPLSPEGRRLCSFRLIHTVMCVGYSLIDPLQPSQQDSPVVFPEA